MPGGIKLFKNEKACFSSLFWVKNFFKMIDLLAIFASEHGKQLLSRLYVAIFLFYVEKMPQGCRGRGSRGIMRIRTTASCQMLCYLSCSCNILHGKRAPAEKLRTSKNFYLPLLNEAHSCCNKFL